MNCRRPRHRHLHRLRHLTSPIVHDIASRRFHGRLSPLSATNRLVSSLVRDRLALKARESRRSSGAPNVSSRAFPPSPADTLRAPVVISLSSSRIFRGSYSQKRASEWISSVACYRSGVKSYVVFACRLGRTNRSYDNHRCLLFG